MRRIDAGASAGHGGGVTWTGPGGEHGGGVTLTGPGGEHGGFEAEEPVFCTLLALWAIIITKMMPAAAKMLSVTSMILFLLKYVCTNNLCEISCIVN